jgi:hypothetical protein
MRKLIIRILKYFGLYEKVEVIKYIMPRNSFRVGDDVVVNYSTGGQVGKISSKGFISGHTFSEGWDEKYLVTLKDTGKETSCPDWLLSKLER